MMKFGIRNSELGIGLNRHPERHTAARSASVSSRFSIVPVIAVFAMALLAPLSFAQQPSDIDAVKKRAELNSAKADLEEARKKRDMAVAARWKDRETANQEREMFNDKYQESKEKVDALMSERARLFEDVRVAREDLAQVKLQA
jgi:biopolymer transport protein ExbB